ncbi:translation initiation factor IF-2 [Streptomyces sp. NBRC 110611]|nr:translation initiation factor IF-2 [Streptomyces sp. NBRC 110611]
MTTPPQGQNPYGQAPYPQQPYGQQPYGQSPYPPAPAPQPPYGQPPQGGYPYPQQPQAPYGPPQPQPGYPVPPQQPHMQGGAPVPPPQPAKRRSVKGILRGIGAVVAVIVVAVAWFSSQDNASSAEAGDCVHKSSSSLDDGLEVVDCSDTKAQYKVTAVHNGTSDTSVCPAGEPSYVKTTHRRRRADTAMVLCLTTVKK